MLEDPVAAIERIDHEMYAKSEINRTSAAGWNHD